MFRSGNTTLIISNKEINDVKIIVSWRILFINKRVRETIKNETNEQKGDFLGMLFGTLDASLLGNLLTGKRAIATSQGRQANMPWRGTIRVGQDFYTASSFNKFWNTKVLSKGMLLKKLFT